VAGAEDRVAFEVESADTKRKFEFLPHPTIKWMVLIGEEGTEIPDDYANYLKGKSPKLDSVEPITKEDT
jgi:hypothetical protein